MAAERRCPNCGALVAEDADWCGQCYAPLTELPGPTSPSGTPPSPTSPGPSTSPGSPEQETGADRGAPVGSQAGTSVEAAAKTATWPCPACDHPNRIELDLCEVCGTPFARLFREQERAPEVEPGSALLWSLAFPGLGHWRCGRTLDGVARGVIFVWTLGTLLVLVLSRVGKGGFGATAPLFVLFLASALTVWVTSAYDAFRIAGGYEPVVSSRTLLWGSVILIVVSVLLASLVTLPAVRGG
ncbi:MAG TPA: zinc ribbon domain-containing protein [Actinomycetota bacterium]